MSEVLPSMEELLKRAEEKGKADVIDEYKDKLIKRLLPRLNDLAFYFIRESEVYKAITEIAEELKG